MRNPPIECSDNADNNITNHPISTTTHHGTGKKACNQSNDKPSDQAAWSKGCTKNEVCCTSHTIFLLFHQKP